MPKRNTKSKAILSTPKRIKKGSKRLYTSRRSANKGNTDRKRRKGRKTPKIVRRKKREYVRKDDGWFDYIEKKYLSDEEICSGLGMRYNGKTCYIVDYDKAWKEPSGSCARMEKAMKNKKRPNKNVVDACRPKEE